MESAYRISRGSDRGQNGNRQTFHSMLSVSSLLIFAHTSKQLAAVAWCRADVQLASIDFRIGEHARPELLAASWKMKVRLR